MTRRLVFRPTATRDLDKIYDYTEERWGFEQAESYIFSLREYCRSLAEQTRRGRALKIKKPGYAALAFKSHFIIYIEGNDEVVIARILHRRMNVEAHL